MSKEAAAAGQATDSNRGSRPIVVVAACFIGLMLGSGAMFGSTFSVFMKPLSDEFGWGRTALSLGISVSAIVVTLIAPFLGTLADRSGPKNLIIASTIAFSLLMGSMALLPPVYGVFLLWAGAVGLCSAGTTSLLYSPVLSQWFSKHLGLSLGIAMTGVGVGTAIAPLLSQALIDAYGWRNAYLALALIIACLGVPNAIFLLRENPRYLARTADAASQEQRPDVPGLTRSEALRSILFWRALVAIILVSTVATGSAIHLAALLTDRGLPAATAAGYLGLFGIAVMASRLASGYLLDKVRSGIVGMVTFAAPAIGLALIASGATGPELSISVLLLGMAYGAESDLLAYIVRTEFGMKAYGAIFGLLFAAFNAGVLAGPLLMGASFDLLGSYRPMLITFIVFSIISALLIMSAGGPRSRRSTH